MALQNRKELGQHWLRNRAILEEIADLAAYGAGGADNNGADAGGLGGSGSGVGGGRDISGRDVGGAGTGSGKGSGAGAGRRMASAPTCLEIGPGLGTLTASLLRRFEKVVAVEFDPGLAAKLPGSFPGKALRVIQADILALPLSEVVAAPYVAAGNIPYYITSPIIKTLLAAQPQPQRIVLLVQKEVAQRLAAGPGSYNPLALYVQNLARVQLGPVVPAAEFTPPPKVDSQVIVLAPRSEAVVSAETLALAKCGFASPRKKLVANLAAAPGCPGREECRRALAELGLNPDARPAELGLGDWERLRRRLAG